MNNLVIGFTGTREDELIDDIRIKKLQSYLLNNKKDIKYVVHGGAIGMDSIFHDFCINNNILVHCRPAYKEPNLKGCFVVHLPKKPLDRNKNIVDDCDILIAVPIDPKKEEERSGTWSTIRYINRLIAQGSNKQIIFI